MSTRRREFDEALAAIQKPLRFARRNNFEHLDRVKNLEATLALGLRRARELSDSEAMRQRIDALERLLPAIGMARSNRVDCLTAFSDALARLRQAEESPAMGQRAPGNPAADPEKQRPAAPSGHPVDIDAAVQFVKGVGPRLAGYLGARGIRTVEDLLRWWPRGYEDRRAIDTIRDVPDGTSISVEGMIVAKSERQMRGRRTLDVAISDETGRVLRLKWFRVPGKAFAERFEKGRRIRASGQVRRYRGNPQMVHPETSVLDGAESTSPVTDALVPIYPEVEGIRPTHLRKIVLRALPAARKMVECLPGWIRKRRGLPTLSDATVFLHHPPVGTPVPDLLRAATPAHRRLIYEELFLVQLMMMRRRVDADRHAGIAIELPGGFGALGAQLFSFALTEAQRRSLSDIERDMGRPVPMNRLLQGDVGCGKTAVAVVAAAAVARAGYQAALLAPTELLAEQHARVLAKTLGPVGIRMALLTGAVTGARRREVLDGLAVGQIRVIVGTHAVIQRDVHFAALALGVVDEQHKFGVKQRARLSVQGWENVERVPHMLVMTATPIPRTLALTVYGDLDLSLIDQLPPGRKPVETQLFRENQRAEVYRRVASMLREGRQAYVVFPLVEESEADGLETVRDATSSAEDLANGPLAGFEVGLLHGRMKPDEKERVMRRFAAGQTSVLVSTTVIEVGIDVPNATVMVVEHAERFGLSQLHQLRGRIGRGDQGGTCLLVARYVSSEDAWRRLKIMTQTSDGFRIAEEDLEIRGPGDFLGTRQSGLPLLNVANLVRDQQILLAAREDAELLLARDPELQAEAHRPLRTRMELEARQMALLQIG